MLWYRFLVSALALTSAGFAESQTLSLRADVSRGPTGHPFVMLTNTRDSDARAYVVLCHYPGPSGSTQTYTVTHDGIGGPPYTVWAGKTEQIGCPLNTERVEVKAVVFDDGRHEGDPQVLAQIALERKAEAQDVAETIQILQDALAQIGHSPFVTPGSSGLVQVHRLAKEFGQRESQHTSNALGPDARDFVCSSIARMLASPIRRQSIDITIRGHIIALQKFAAVLHKQPDTSSGSSSNSGAN